MTNEYTQKFRYPIDLSKINIFGHDAELRLFREPGERHSYFITIAFPSIKDDVMDEFILEREGDVFIVEEQPSVNMAKNNIDITWEIVGSMREKDALVHIRIKIKNTPIDTTSTFWASAINDLRLHSING